ncbi:hypothetical protein AB0D22_38580, partial [Kitasatospora sp. NPDC048538]
APNCPCAPSGTTRRPASSSPPHPPGRQGRQLHKHPTIAYRPLTDAPPVPLLLAWRRGVPTHPAIPDLVRLTRDLLAGG